MTHKLLCKETTTSAFTVGKQYDITGYDFEGDFEITDDYGNTVVIDRHDLHSAYTNAANPLFEIGEESTAISNEYEEEEFKRLEKNTQVCTDPKVYGACCDVALAYQLSQIQKFLRESGADIELVVHKDFLAINDENCKEYRGNVEQILRYIKASGELSKAADEMDRRN